MTLVEFLAPLRQGRHRDKVAATLYFMKRYQGVEAATVEMIRKALVQARVSKAKQMNIAAILANSGSLVDSPGSEGGRRLWAITDTGEGHVRELLALPAAEPEVEHDVGALSALVQQVTDEDVRGYIEEAITCLRFGALRAAVVFLWTAAIRTLHENAMNAGEAAVNAAIQKQDSKARQVRKADDFAYVKDRTFLDALPEIGILDKGQKDTLVEALNLRNRCGHPTKYRPGEAKVRGYIEDIIGIVFN